jgi:hypothetical protein
MILVRLLNLRFLNEHAAMNDRNLKFAALVARLDGTRFKKPEGRRS